MKPEVLRAALRVCAKVAMTAAVASCGGRQSVDAPMASAPGPDAASAELDVSVAPALESTPLSCNPPPPESSIPVGTHRTAVVDDGTFACCAESLSALKYDGGASFPGVPDAALASGELLDCCVAVIARIDEDQYDAADAAPAAEARLTADRATADGEQSVCCSPQILGSLYPKAIGPTCSPWGPPMPPSMPEDDAQTPEAAC